MHVTLEKEAQASSIMEYVFLGHPGGDDCTITSCLSLCMVSMKDAQKDGHNSIQ